MDKDRDGTGARKCLGDLLCDDTGFSDTGDHDLAVTLRDQLNRTLDARFIKPGGGTFDMEA